MVNEYREKIRERMGKMKMYCEACDAHFWVDSTVELAVPDYVCPYCGESKDVRRATES